MMVGLVVACLIFTMMGGLVGFVTFGVGMIGVGTLGSMARDGVSCMEGLKRDARCFSCVLVWELMGGRSVE